MNITWYSFEENMQRIMVQEYEKAINGKVDADETCTEFNDLFAKIESLLAEYLRNVYEVKDIVLLEKMQECFDENTLAISFNYTDTIKLYTDKYYYVHGSLEDDNQIILGFANSDNLPCLCGDNFIFYQKEVKKELLNFKRFLIENGCHPEKIDEEIAAFRNHAIALYSGRGEYNLEYEDVEKSIYDTSGMSLLAKKYAEKYNFAPMKEEYDYMQVTEVCVAGHGLEADRSYLDYIFEKAVNINRVVLYTYKGEPKEELERKIKKLKELANTKNIEIRLY